MVISLYFVFSSLQIPNFQISEFSYFSNFSEIWLFYRKYFSRFVKSMNFSPFTHNFTGRLSKTALNSQFFNGRTLINYLNYDMLVGSI